MRTKKRKKKQLNYCYMQNGFIQQKSCKSKNQIHQIVFLRILDFIVLMWNSGAKKQDQNKQTKQPLHELEDKGHRDPRGREGNLNRKNSERETDHGRLWTPGNTLKVTEGEGWGDRVTE